MAKVTLKFSLLEGKFAVCRFPPDTSSPEWAYRTDPFVSITRTSEELSIVCAEDRVPPEVRAERGWVCLKLHGPFLFAETGILTAFVTPLSDAGLPIFAISTFDTDYVLIKEEFWSQAQKALEKAGHQITPTPVG